MYSETMPFGKHRGHRLVDVPTDYLLWCLRECSSMKPWTRDAIRREVDRRQYGRREEERRTSSSSSSSSPPVQWAAVIQTWYRELSMRWHPDRGGTNEAMAAINDARQRLEQLLAS